MAIANPIPEWRPMKVRPGKKKKKKRPFTIGGIVAILWSTQLPKSYTQQSFQGGVLPEWIHILLPSLHQGKFLSTPTTPLGGKTPPPQPPLPLLPALFTPSRTDADIVSTCSTDFKGGQPQPNFMVLTLRSPTWVAEPVSISTGFCNLKALVTNSGCRTQLEQSLVSFSTGHSGAESEHIQTGSH